MALIDGILLLVVIVLGFMILSWIAEHIKAIMLTILGIGILIGGYWLLENHPSEFGLLLKLLFGGFAIFFAGYIIMFVFHKIRGSARDVRNASVNYAQSKAMDRSQKSVESLLQWLAKLSEKKEIGFVTMEDMRQMLSNYSQSGYLVDQKFDEVVSKFVNDSEQQNFTNNPDWAEPYVRHIISLGARSLKQLQEEVDGALRHHMHFTPDGMLLQQALETYTQRKGVEVPPILTKTTMNGTTVYEATEYGVRLYSGTLDHSESEELDFNDL